jgi:formyltetrahydrofolate deformylase
MNKKDTAILLIHCKEKKGTLASVTDFLRDNNAHIIRLNQHIDHQENHFYMRVEWALDDFNIPRNKIGEFFETLIAKKYDMTWKLEFSDTIPRVAVFVSKYAHCFYDILSRYDSGEWKIEIPLIISNHEKFRPVAERLGIPYYHIPITKENKAAQEKEELRLLKEYKIDVVVLARYMQVLSDDFIKHYPDRIINIHHSSLPAFAGANPYKAAYQRGVKFMGATGHYVTAELDAGPIISQNVVPISHRDSLADLKRKGKDIEKVVLAKAVWLHINYNVLAYKNKTVVFG